MTTAISTKLEIDVMQATEIREAVELAVVHQMPAMVVHPDLVPETVVLRAVRQGRFNIIVPIDWPKGERNAMAKLQHINVDALSQDGFEILVSHKDSASATQAELKMLSEFIRVHLREVVEVRFVLGTIARDWDSIKRIVSVLKDVPAPAMLRTDCHLRTQQSKASPQVHNKLIHDIRELYNVPIKVSGNINSIRAVLTTRADRFAVSLKQAKTIIAEVKENPEKVRKLLAMPHDRIAAEFPNEVPSQD